MLTTVEYVQGMPGMLNPAIAPTPWLNQLIGAASQVIETYLKRNIELRAYQEYYSGRNTLDIMFRNFPVFIGSTTVAPASSGLALPQATIFVNSVLGFNPGTNNDLTVLPPSFAVQTGINAYTVVQYTGTQTTPAPAFTGCTGGTGTLSSANTLNAVFSPIIFFDMQGFSGQNPGGFPESTILRMGSQFMVAADKEERDGSQKSSRGLARRTGSAGSAFIGFYPENFYSGKLSAYREPAWTRGNGNYKLLYSAGYWPVPFDLQYAAALLVAYMVRIMPYGYPLQSETLGAYSYTIASMLKGIPEIGSLARTLAPYRESAWGYP